MRAYVRTCVRVRRPLLQSALFSEKRHSNIQREIEERLFSVVEMPIIARHDRVVHRV